jgi:hypothetical protein
MDTLICYLYLNQCKLYIYIYMFKSGEWLLLLRALIKYIYNGYSHVIYIWNGRQADSEEDSNIQPKKKTKHRTPIVKMEGPAYSSRGRNRPRMA